MKSRKKTLKQWEKHVKDTNTGMPEYQQQQLAKTFFNRDKQTPKKPEDHLDARIKANFNGTKTQLYSECINFGLEPDEFEIKFAEDDPEKTYNYNRAYIQVNDEDGETRVPLDEEKFYNVN